MSTNFHDGELDVQQQAGVEQMAARVGQILRPQIPPMFDYFLAQQPFIVAASADSQHRLWASILVGPPPFIEVLDRQTVQIKAAPHRSDPLAQNLQTQGEIGLIAIEFAQRSRVRLNGTAVAHSDGFTIHTNQAYGNCPKYIQARTLTQTSAVQAPKSAQSKRLSTDHINWITTADTFFIASADKQGQADASHRGGQPGFVKVEADQIITFPDYSGNMMFNTLGNIAVNPHAGLLFIDFENNRTLQLTGTAALDWNPDHIAQFPGAERLVTFKPTQAIETQDALPFRWRFHSFSQVNPQLT